MGANDFRRVLYVAEYDIYLVGKLTDKSDAMFVRLVTNNALIVWQYFNDLVELIREITSFKFIVKAS